MSMRYLSLTERRPLDHIPFRCAGVVRLALGVIDGRPGGVVAGGYDRGHFRYCEVGGCGGFGIPFLGAVPIPVAACFAAHQFVPCGADVSVFGSDGRGGLDVV